MQASDEFADLETALYEAAILPELWPRVLTQLGTFSDSAGAALLCINERGVHFTTAPILEHVMDRFVKEDWDTRNSRRGNVMAKGLVGAPRFVNEDDYLAPGEAETDPMINELFRAEGFGWASGFIQDLPHGDLVILNLEQFYERGPIRGAALDKLNLIYPHVARAATIAGRADFARVKTAIETLTALGLPAAALTPSLRVVLANQAFETASHAWTTRAQDRLALYDTVAGKMLADAIAHIDEGTLPRSIPLRGQAGGLVTAVLQIAPIKRAAHDVFGSSTAIVVLSEPKRAGRDATLVQSLFDLTATELAVASSIAAGQTVAQIAANTGRSVHTVRNQLASILQKTGCGRQSELVILMNQLSGRIV